MKKHSAFTMIELVMVIVVFGIVASIGAEIVASLYKNYLRTRAINRLQSQTEIVLEQIAKRLQYRIKDSVRAIKPGSIVPLPSADGTYGTIEWIGISNESFLGEHDGVSVVPGWSGFIDMDSNNTKLATRTLETPGSRLDFARDIILALTNGDVDMNNENGNLPALIFKNSKPLYNVNSYYSQGGGNYTVRVSKVAGANTRLHIPADDNLTDFDNDGVGSGDLFEQYYLSHTAYALVPVGNASDFNLTLVYNYQPWQGETYTANGTTSVLSEHVSTFRIRQEGDVVRIKLCIHDNNQSGDFDFSACKEKVIF
ncbi:type II secretion system protein [Sulfurospirillum oryzae]|uniref:type II secretion system protein n=1 Tax=Sulfurospirillum oryzae TaxID=2976535 RepID=UPI0021E6F21D|nr:type II secretion system protein [Sulfurospirillum oryzae]